MSERQVEEARLTRTEAGLVSEGEGWFVVNAKEAPWERYEGWGAACVFESKERLPQIGVNIQVLRPGEPNCMYHAEDMQEDFLVLSGECILVVEGEERRLEQWDYFHSPPWTRHVFIGAGDGPCAILMIGARKPDDQLLYPVEEAALRHGAGVREETDDPRVAYADLPPGETVPYREGDLPGEVDRAG